MPNPWIIQIRLNFFSNLWHKQMETHVFDMAISNSDCSRYGNAIIFFAMADERRRPNLDNHSSKIDIAMNSRLFLFLVLITFAVALTSDFSMIGVHAQSASGEKTRLKNFGSSLKRLKWDPKKNVAVEIIAKEKRDKHSDDDVVRVQTSLVVSDVLVLDKLGNSVSGLTQSDFMVTEDGRPQQVDVFSAGDGRVIPRSIVLIIDYSLSQAGFVETSIKAAMTLIDALRPQDRMAIVTDRVELLADFSADKKDLKQKLESLIGRNGTTSYNALAPIDRQLHRWGSHYSALLATLNEAFDSKDQLPVIIFQANGNEASVLQNPIVGPAIPPDYLTGDEKKKTQERFRKENQAQQSQLREFSLNDVHEAAAKSRATIYTIVPGLRLIGLPRADQIEHAKDWARRFRSGWQSAVSSHTRLLEIPDWMWDSIVESSVKEQYALLNLARMTGGWSDFIQEPTQAAEVYSRILSDMSHRYVVGYYPSNKERDGKLRRIGIEIRRHPEYVILLRKSYYAPLEQ
jgi:VWFA-related protein